MGKTFRFDPDFDSGNSRKRDRKADKQARKDRRKKDAMLDNQMAPTDDRSTSTRILDDVMDGEWDKF